MLQCSEIQSESEVCLKPLLHLDLSKVLITHSSMCACLSFNDLFQAYCTKSKDGVVVKVETLHPLESIAVNNVLSCFGNDNWGGNTSSVFCSSTLSRCRMNLWMLDFKFHLNVHTAFKEVPIEVLVQKTLCCFRNNKHACVLIIFNDVCWVFQRHLLKHMAHGTQTAIIFCLQLIFVS